MLITLPGQLSWHPLRRLAVDLYSKAKKSLFEPPFMALWGNVRTPCMARWKARGRLYIHCNWSFFAISYGWDVMSGNRSKSAFFEGGVTLTEDLRRKGASPTNHCWYRSSRVIALSCGIEIFAVRCLVLSQYTHLTDRQTDKQNSDSNTVRCITRSRTVKTERQ